MTTLQDASPNLVGGCPVRRGGSFPRLVVSHLPPPSLHPALFVPAPEAGGHLIKEEFGDSAAGGGGGGAAGGAGKGKSSAGAEQGKAATGMPIEDPAFDQGLRRMRPGKIGKVDKISLSLLTGIVFFFFLYFCFVLGERCGAVLRGAVRCDARGCLVLGTVFAAWFLAVVVDLVVERSASCCVTATASYYVAALYDAYIWVCDESPPMRDSHIPEC